MLSKRKALRETEERKAQFENQSRKHARKAMVGVHLAGFREMPAESDMFITQCKLSLSEWKPAKANVTGKQ